MFLILDVMIAVAMSPVAVTLVLMELNVIRN